MIVIGVPTTGSIPVKVIGSIESVLLSRKDVVPYYIEGSLVYDARANIVNYALQKGADLLFLDSDIQFSLEAFNSLIGRDTDVVSGLYYSRRKPSYPVAYKTVKPQTIFRPAKIETITEIRPYMEVAGAGLGFCLIKNKVLRSLPKNVNPFEPFGGLGEDFCFFLRLRKKGFKVMLDTTFELKHLGQYGYTAIDCEG